MLRITFMQMPGNLKVGAFCLQHYFLAERCSSELPLPSVPGLGSTEAGTGSTPLQLLAVGVTDLLLPAGEQRTEFSRAAEQDRP